MASYPLAFAELLAAAICIDKGVLGVQSALATPPSSSVGGSAVSTSPAVAGKPVAGVAVPGVSTAEATSAIATAAAKHNVPLYVFYGMFQMESSLGHDINTSSANAIGPFQFIPSTARSYGYPLTNSPSPAQFAAQADAAAHFLSDLYNQLGHSWTNALAGYNAGPFNLGAGMGYANSAISRGHALVG